MDVPPRWYKQPPSLPDEPTELSVAILLALLRLQWWHVPNIVTEARVVGSLALVFTAIVIDFGIAVPEESLHALFSANGVAPTIFWLFVQPGFWTTTVFVLTAATDKLDGFLAKSIFGKTQLGAALDPLVDKLLMAIGIVVAIVLCVARGEWLLAMSLLATLVFLWGFREPNVIKLKVAAARASNEISSARESGRITMVVFCVALSVILMPVVGLWSTVIKLSLLLLFVALSALSWRDYQREYGRYLP